MAYSRGTYGIEYNDARHPQGPRRAPWICLVAVLTLAAFVWARWKKAKTNVPPPNVSPAITQTSETPKPVPVLEEKPLAIPTPHPATSTRTNGVPAIAAPAPQPPAAPRPKSPAVLHAEAWLRTAQARPPVERALLERLATAEREEKFDLAIDSLKKLRLRPTMADLSDALSRRLGTLNRNLLLSGKPTPWTTTVTVKRGDNARRLAREHGGTWAAVLALNPGINPAKLKIGDRVRLLEFPRAQLVVHRPSHYADLSLNGSFFGRYVITPGPKTPTGPYPVTRDAGPRTRFAELDLHCSPSTLEELELFLAPGSSIILADP